MVRKSAAKTAVGRQPAPSRRQLAAILAECGITLEAGALALLWRYHQLLRQHNPDLNLTRIHNFRNMVIKLYADSILPGTLITLPSPLLDLGSGPGLPGIPLKIAFPQVTIRLAESREVRNEFLRRVCRELQLPGLEVVGGGISPRYEEPVAGVITRAVEPIDRTLERVAGCLAEQGLALFMKGPNCDDEVAAAVARHRGEYTLEADRAYRIPGTGHHRRLVVFRRRGRPPAAARHLAEARHPVREVASEQNSLFKDLKKLLSGRGVKKEGGTLVAGAKLVAELLADFPELCLAWIGRPQDPPPPANAPPHLAWYRLAPALFAQLDTAGTRRPLLLMRVPAMVAWDQSTPLPSGCTLLVPFQDPENVGAVIRSAAAFGVSQVVLLQEAAHPFHPKALRAAGGAVFRVAIKTGPPLAQLSPSPAMIALSAEGRPLAPTSFPPAFLLLAGREGQGLPPALRANSWSIPMAGGVESLNAATAVAVALYAWRLGTAAPPRQKATTSR